MKEINELNGNQTAKGQGLTIVSIIQLTPAGGCCNGWQNRSTLTAIQKYPFVQVTNILNVFKRHFLCSPRLQLFDQNKVKINK